MLEGAAIAGGGTIETEPEYDGHAIKAFKGLKAFEGLKGSKSCMWIRCKFCLFFWFSA